MFTSPHLTSSHTTTVLKEDPTVVKTKAAEAAVVMLATRTLLPRVPVPHYDHQIMRTTWKSSSTSKVLPMDQTSNSNGSHRPPHPLLQINHSSRWASFLHCFSNVLPLSIARPSKCSSSSLHSSDSNCTRRRHGGVPCTSHRITSITPLLPIALTDLHLIRPLVCRIDIRRVASYDCSNCWSGKKGRQVQS